MAEQQITLANYSDLEGMMYATDTDQPTGEVEFTSYDTTLDPTTTESVALLTSSDTWGSRFQKISQMFKNIRYLLKMLGTTSISSIGNGTATGAISALGGKITSGTSISVSDFITLSTGITLAGSGHFLYKTPNHIYVKLMFTGSTTSNAGGYINVGTINSAYRPSAAQSRGIVINVASSGQVRGPAVAEIYAGGTLRIATGANAATYGNSTYPWATDAGIVIDYAL